MISCSRQPAVGTLVPPLRQGLADFCTTETRLARAARVNLYQPVPSLFRFVRKLREKARPSSIVDGLGEHAAGQAFDVQILDGDHVIGVDQGASDFVLKVRPLVFHLGVGFLEQQYGFAAILSPALAARDTALSQAQFGLSPLVVARVVNLCAISERGKSGQANVHPCVCVDRRQGVPGHLDTEAGIPFAALAFDRYRLERAIDGTMQLDFEMSHPLEIQPCASQSAAIPA
jgi:hypothetical protein